MVATALTVYGIETRKVKVLTSVEFKLFVATALTVYGIETELNGGFGASVVSMLSCNSTYRLRY